MGKVELNRENINRCLCKICPVQTESKCSKDKLDIVNEKIKREGDVQDILNPEEIPLVYCAIGKASCSDLSSRELCKCTQCNVWLENNLANNEPIEYFCVEGLPK
jgi:hypothetical protein